MSSYINTFNTYFVPQPVLDAAAIFKGVAAGNTTLAALPVGSVASLAARAALVCGATLALTKAFAVSKIAFGAVVLATTALSAPTLAGAAGAQLLLYSVSHGAALSAAGVTVVAAKTFAIAAASWLVGVAVLRNYARIELPSIPSSAEVVKFFDGTGKGYIERMLFA